MAPHQGGRKQRTEAVSALKDAFTRQFGAQAQSVVEAHVDAHLSRVRGQIGREDIDTIEKGVIAALREKRGGAPRKEKPLAKSAPSLTLGSTAQGSSAPGGLLPPLTPTMPLGSPNPGALVRSTSTPALTSAPRMKPKRPPPYGLSLTGGTGFEHKDRPDSSRPIPQPRYPVPLPPKLKPVDHWDLIVAFDSAKYRREEEMKDKVGHYEKMATFKGVLDGQVQELQEAQELEKRGLREERELILAQVEQNEEYDREEKTKLRKKKEEQNSMNTVMLEHIKKQRRKEEERKANEQEEVTRWLEKEKLQKEEDERNQRIEYKTKCTAARERLEEARRDREERRKAEQEHELHLMAVRNQILEEQEAAKAKALQDRIDHMKKIEASLGEQVAGRDAEEAAELEARIRRIQEEASRKAADDAKSRLDKHNAKVKDMLATRVLQIEERGKGEKLQKEADKKQLQIFKQQQEESNQQEKAKLEKKRKAREDLDIHLISQIRRNAGIHPQHIMMTPRNKKTELSYNKALFEQMEYEGFQAGVVGTMMKDRLQLPDHHPEGKLIDAPTVPRYTAAIHPLELEAPDV